MQSIRRHIAVLMLALAAALVMPTELWHHCEDGAELELAISQDCGLCDFHWTTTAAPSFDWTPQPLVHSTPSPLLPSSLLPSEAKAPYALRGPPSPLA